MICAIGLFFGFINIASANVFQEETQLNFYSGKFWGRGYDLTCESSETDKI